MNIDLSLSEIAQITGGRVLGASDIAIPSIQTDSRSIQPGEWFLALRGENFDGHAFLSQVAQSGAAGAIVSDESTVPKNAPAGWPVLVVADTLAAYGDIAHAWRARMNARVVCIAGSGGKTTTKEMLAHAIFGVLGTKKTAGAPVPHNQDRLKAELRKKMSIPQAEFDPDSILVSRGNYNNLIGLPRTLLQLAAVHKLALAEIGMNVAGELGRLTRIADPDLAALTNIGDAHVGQFGSLDALARAKAELPENMRPGATIVANASCVRSMETVHRYGKHLRVVWFSALAGADYSIANLRPISPFGYAFSLLHVGESHPVRLQIFGRHNVANAVCALALAGELGFPLRECAAALDTFRPAPMRSELQELGGVFVVEDCYNASPSAVVAAVESMADLQNPGSKHLVLGDMFELGEMEAAMHRRVGEAAAKLPGAIVYAVGERSRAIHDAASENGARAHWFANKDDAVENIVNNVNSGDAVLFKASRRMGFETLAQRVKQALSGDAAQADATTPSNERH